MHVLGTVLVLVGAALVVRPSLFEPRALPGLLGPLPTDLHLLVGILGGSVAGLGAIVIADARPGPSQPERWTPLSAWCAVNVALAVSMVTCIDTWLYAPWTAQVDASPQWLGFMFLLIGPAIGMHFAIAARVARRGHADRVLISVLVWFLLDSTRTALEGGWFNLVMPNIPCMLGTLAFWYWDRRLSLRSDRSAPPSAS